MPRSLRFPYRLLRTDWSKPPATELVGGRPRLRMLRSSETAESTRRTRLSSWAELIGYWIVNSRNIPFSEVPGTSEIQAYRPGSSVTLK